MNHFAVHLKLTQHGKSTILQYKIKFFLNKVKRNCTHSMTFEYIFIKNA